MQTETSNVKDIYQRRFNQTPNEGVMRMMMWKILVHTFFQKFIPSTSTVLEVACGYGEFINQVHAHRKIAIDLNPDSKSKVSRDVEFHESSSTDMGAIPSSSVDIIFMSNFLEHITKEAVIQTVRECRRVLKKDGKLLILGPNMRYVANDFWIFWDHIHPTDDRAICEMLEIENWTITLNIPRFLPYTTKSLLPNSPALIEIYLRFPLLWRFFGKQFFIVAKC
ncbi:MAG: class I SAM-dependent methyltransferase [Candidatus Roizmanbacteria bacterium]